MDNRLIKSSNEHFMLNLFKHLYVSFLPVAGLIIKKAAGRYNLPAAFKSG